MTVTVLENCLVFDGHDEDLIEGAAVVVEDARIVEVGRAAKSAGRRIDCRGGFLMPGLIDCHFHAYTPSFDIYGLDRMPMPLLANHAAKLLEGALLRGFTTVRDAAGGDIGLALAIEKGLIEGPRFFFCGKALSQTGGHGDMRPNNRVEPCQCDYVGCLSVVVDGVDAVRKAVREELRKGATQIKIFVSGGVVSPTDPIWMPQFTAEEIRAAVEEAATRRTYVMAHCHTDERARVCVEQGIRSIEHGTEIHPETAALIARSGTYVVPTMSVADVVCRHAPELGLPPASLEKIRGIYERMVQSVENCVKAGVKLGLGTDLLGDYHDRQGGEFRLRGEFGRPVDVLRSATSVNAEILQKPDELGCIRPGAYADMIVVRGNPLEDLSLFADAARNIPLIMRGGRVIKHTPS
jgi:imidazolonepropionase-like amidohydrolase